MKIISKIVPESKIMSYKDENKIAIFDGKSLIYIHFNNKAEIDSLISRLTELRDRVITTDPIKIKTKKRYKLFRNKVKKPDNIGTTNEIIGNITHC